MMEVRNPVYSGFTREITDDNDNTLVFNGINCEVNTPKYGWQPCHIFPDEYLEEYTAALNLGVGPFVAVPVTTAQVDEERDVRLYGGVTFVIDGVEHTFDSDLVSQQRVDSMAALARFAVSAGAQAGDYRWHGATTDFQWISADNSLVTMDAIEMVALGDRFVEWISGVVFSGRTIKNMDPIPTDYATDSRWPT